MTDFLIRIEGQWFPAGAYFLVQCGRGDDHHLEVPVLSHAGWVSAPALLELPLLERLRLADLGHFWTKELAKQFLQEPHALMVRAAIEDAMFAPKLVEGWRHDIAVSCTDANYDPRVGWKV